MTGTRRETEDRVAFRTIDQKLDTILEMLREMKRTQDSILRVVTDAAHNGEFYDLQFCAALTAINQNDRTVWLQLIQMLRESGNQTPVELPEPIAVGYKDVEGMRQEASLTRLEDNGLKNP